MKLKTVLFDLDGTLCPMDQDAFVAAYLKAISEKMEHLGYERKKFINTIWQGTIDMVANDGQATNENVFRNTFASVYGNEALSDFSEFEKFYINDFDSISTICTPDPSAIKAVEYIKSKGVRVALATNPLFPSIATEKRICWAGFMPADFEFFTSYENSHFCKPNIKYYKEILTTYNIDPDNCLMVGNDACEDTIAEKLGIKVFLIEKHLINKKNLDITLYPRGDFNDLINFIDSNCKV